MPFSLPMLPPPIRLALLLATAWTLVIGGSLLWNGFHERMQKREEAYAEARANLNKDITFRRWTSEHGGVYVPITDQQKSVPWLSHVPGRDVTTVDGRQLTLLNPATVMRQVMDRHAKEFGIRGRITGLKYLNPANAPDVWEKEQLLSFERGEKKEVWEETDIEGKPYLRYLRAMFMEPGCEKCHAILGYKLGDLRGATGLSLPLTPYLERQQASYVTHAVSHGAIWLLGLFGISWIGRKTQQQDAARRADENRIAKAELWYRSLFEQSHDGILIFDPADQHFVEFNHVAHEMLGYSREEFRKIRLAKFEAEESPADTAARIMRISETGSDRFETRHRKKNGELIDVQVVVQQITSEDKPLFLCSFRDITERKRTEAELEKHRSHLEDEVSERTRELAEKNTALETTVDTLNKAQESLVQAEKLASLGALVAGIAHEINTPIGNSRTIASALKEITEDLGAHLEEGGTGLRRSEFLDYIARMREGTGLLEHSMVRAADLVHSFKQVAVDRTSSVRRPFDLREVVSDVLSTLHPTIKKTPFSLELDIPPKISLDSYPGPLGQVIVNLVENALLHGLEGRVSGRIQVSAIQLDKGLVQIQVCDDGRGIPEKNCRRIFDPFFTTRLGKGGSGLGLNIVHNIVVAVLGGTIVVESHAEQGARFDIRIPSVAPAPQNEVDTPE